MTSSIIGLFCVLGSNIFSLIISFRVLSSHNSVIRAYQGTATFDNLLSSTVRSITHYHINLETMECAYCKQTFSLCATGQKSAENLNDCFMEQNKGQCFSSSVGKRSEIEALADGGRRKRPTLTSLPTSLYLPEMMSGWGETVSSKAYWKCGRKDFFFFKLLWYRLVMSK